MISIYMCTLFELEIVQFFLAIKIIFSLFDTPAERYAKMKANINTVIPLQVGLTAFGFDSLKNSYSGKVYTFYVQPACFQYIHRNFYLQTSTINFLRLYNFDFNKVCF